MENTDDDKLQYYTYYGKEVTLFITGEEDDADEGQTFALLRSSAPEEPEGLVLVILQGIHPVLGWKVIAQVRKIEADLRANGDDRRIRVLTAPQDIFEYDSKLAVFYNTCADLEDRIQEIESGELDDSFAKMVYLQSMEIQQVAFIHETYNRFVDELGRELADEYLCLEQQCLKTVREAHKRTGTFPPDASDFTN